MLNTSPHMHTPSADYENTRFCKRENRSEMVFILQGLTDSILRLLQIFQQARSITTLFNRSFGPSAPETDNLKKVFFLSGFFFIHSL